MNKNPKVAVAMSGGVDSSVAAALLVEQGLEVVGLHLHLWVEQVLDTRYQILGIKIENRCCSTEQLEGARKTAQLLKIPFYVLNFEESFKKAVVDYFLEEYGRLRTPNPCVVCNKFIRFGKLLDYALKLGCDYLATGHYVRIRSDDASVGYPAHSRANVLSVRPSGSAPLRGAPGLVCVRGHHSLCNSYHLLSGIDKTKDQSYFLYTLTQKQLAHILFPIGHLKKTEVRQIAQEKNLPVAARPESQEICFMVSDDYRDFLCRYIPEKIKPGSVVNLEGEVIGRHRGLPLYTIGQRRGFKTDLNIPLYVVGFDKAKNTLIVGRGKESETKEFAVKNVNWIAGKAPKLPLNCQVRIRHGGELLNAKCKMQNAKFMVELKEPERGVTPGQSAVFYQGEEVLGGGVIKR